MADDEHLRILKTDVETWNEWRASNPKIRPHLADADLTSTDLTGANLKNADLGGANLAGANLTGADLRGANLAGAQFWNANLTDANLTGANLRNTNLRNADLTSTDLTGANLTAAVLGEARFGHTLVNSETQGLDLLTEEQRDELVFVDRYPDANARRRQEPQRVESGTLGPRPHSDAGGRGHQVLPAPRSSGGDTPMGAGGRGHQVLPAMRSGPPGTFARSDAPSRAAQITVGTAQHIVGPAHEVLIGLSIPNDLSEAHRDLFLELLRTIEDLQQSLAGLNDENRRLSDESEELREKIDDALPLWKKAWETFVLKSAEGAGISVGKGAVFTAGFIAGMTYSAFATEPPGIPI